MEELLNLSVLVTRASVALIVLPGTTALLAYLFVCVCAGLALLLYETP
jgi:hypothetical protein